MKCYLTVVISRSRNKSSIEGLNKPRSRAVNKLDQDNFNNSIEGWNKTSIELQTSIELLFQPSIEVSLCKKNIYKKRVQKKEKGEKRPNCAYTYLWSL